MAISRETDQNRKAEAIWEEFANQLREKGYDVKTGVIQDANLQHLIQDMPRAMSLEVGKTRPEEAGMVNGRRKETNLISDTRNISR